MEARGSRRVAHEELVVVLVACGDDQSAGNCIGEEVSGHFERDDISIPVDLSVSLWLGFGCVSIVFATQKSAKGLKGRCEMLGIVGSRRNNVGGPFVVVALFADSPSMDGKCSARENDGYGLNV